MKKYTPAIAAAFGLSMMFFACSKKDNNPTNPGPGPYSSIESVYAKLALQPKVVTVNTQWYNILRGNSGTEYSFYPMSFIDSAGNLVVGDIQLYLTEYLKPGDMIFSKVLPLSHGQLLASGGEINVQAFKDGARLFLRPSRTFLAAMPTFGKSASGMSLFTGQSITDTSTQRTNWTARTGSVIGVTAIGVDTALLYSDSLNFSNADKFLSFPNYKTFKVKVTTPSGVTLTEAPRAFAKYDGYVAAWPIHKELYENGTFSETHVPDIPVHFMVFAVINGNFYGGITPATPQDGQTYTVNLAVMDPAVFKDQLNAL